MITSAGILPYRFKNKELQVMLVHPGGPFWKNKNFKTWSIAKGEIKDNESHLDAAKREFKEETNFDIINENFIDLLYVRHPRHPTKLVKIWAIENDFDVSKLKSNTFDLEYPKGSEIRTFPEVDKAEWFFISEAREKILPKQIAFLRRLIIELDKKGEI